MRPEHSGDLDDSGAEEISLAQFEANPFGTTPGEDADLFDLGSLSPHHLTTVEAREHHDPPPKVDANFFNNFDDDFDESDMKA